MINISNLSRTLLICGLFLCTSIAQAQVITLDFETDAQGNSLANGLAITEPPAGNDDIDIFDSDVGGTLAAGNGNQLIAISDLVTIASTGNDHVGVAIFDSTPFVSGGTSGPNASIHPENGDIADPDLLVDSGNVLILQEDSNIAGPDTRRDGDGNLIFNQPDDDVNDGSIFFDFSEAVTAISIDLVDFNGGASGVVTLTDLDGDERVFTIPEEFTFDLSEVLEDTEGDALGDGDPSNDAAEGFATLLFDESDPQDGEGRLDDAGNPIVTSVVDNGDFDIDQVTRIEVAFGGPNPSGAVDNLEFAINVVPEPSAGLLLGMVSVCLAARRRRTVAA